MWLALEGVIFIDCGCVREIELARRAVVTAGRQFELTAASPMFARVAELGSYDELAALADAVVRRPWRSSEERRRIDGEFREVVADLEELFEPPE